MSPSLTRAAAIVALLALGLSLSGCSKCGWIWNEWGRPGACRTVDTPK